MPAAAFTQFSYQSQLPVAGATYSFSGPRSVAVDQATGDVAVADTGDNAVDILSPAGASLAKLTGFGTLLDNSVAFDDSTGHVFVADSSTDQVDEFNPSTGYSSTVWTGSNTTAGSFGGGGWQIQVAADDTTGDVYVLDPAHGAVDHFDSTGKFLGSWTSWTGASAGSFGNPASIAVDQATGDVYVLDTGNDAVDVFDPTGNFMSSFSGSGAGPGGGFNNGLTDGITIDDKTGNIIVADSSYVMVYVFDMAGHYQEALSGSDTPAGSFNYCCYVSVAANNSTGALYVGDSGNNVVDAFAGKVIPDVTTGAATNVTETTAEVSGTVNPDGLPVTDCHFDYGTDISYGESVPCIQTPAEIGSGTAAVSVSADLTGLTSGMVYHLRLAAANANGTNEGQDSTLDTVSAGWGIRSFDNSAENEDGSTDTQAGSHPYALTTSFTINTVVGDDGIVKPVENFKDVVVGLPVGLVGNPSAVPRCTYAELSSAPESTCPAASQVGTLTLDASGTPASAVEAVYNLVPPPGVPAEFGFIMSSHAVFIDMGVRTGGDYGITATIRNASQAEAFTGAAVTLWGDPADPSHDSQRFCAGSSSPGCSTGGEAQVPLLTMPTACPVDPQVTTVKIDTWENPGVWTTATSVSHTASGKPVAITGCDRLDFTPSITAQPTVSSADSPSGLAVDLHLPDYESPTGLAEADLKDATVTLPLGVSVSPSAADGRQACTPDEIGLDNASEPTCPDASKVGSVEVDTPLLADPLKGYVYLAQQYKNPFGSLLAIYVTAEADGVLVKLAGHVVPDPKTGQLTTTFENNPQLPFTDFKLDFWGGPRAALATPETCGTYTTTSSLSPWSGTSAATPSDPNFTVDTGCVTGFAPTFTAGATNVQAGAYSPFVMSLSRSDADQELSGLSVKLPTGVLAKLAGVAECSDAQLAAAAASSGAAEQASPSCPSSSQVGEVKVGSGPGSNPLFLPGQVYLTGPYKGAPYGLAVVVPAVAGPFDLGTVVVRQALQIDPSTAQVTDVSDPFPTILDGIPLRLRRIDVVLDRQGFMLNPTSCDPTAITGSLTSTLGVAAPLSSRYQVGGCASLGFSPRLRMALTGRGQTRSGDHPMLVSTLRQGHGQANLRTVRVTLPLSLALDPNNSSHVCAYATAQAVHGGSVGCPASTVIGSASARTPLLSTPLAGKVYLVQGIRYSHGVAIHTLPSLLIPLRGQIPLDLRAQTSVSHGRLVTTFPAVPDAPVSQFTLRINGGRKGIIVITGRGQTICGKPQIAGAGFGAQNGDVSGTTIRMSTPCRGAHGKKHHHKASNHHNRTGR